MSNPTKRDATLAVALLLILGGAAAWWFWPRTSAMPDAKPSAQGLAGLPAIALKIGENGKLDEKAFEDIRKQILQNRIDDMRAYGKMSPEEKKKKLDEDIDNMEKARKLRPTSLPTSMPADGKPGVTVQGDQNNKRITIRLGGGGQKAAMEDLPPDVRAIMSQYEKDIRDRRAERGLPDAPGGAVIIRSSGPMPIPGK